MTAIDRPIFIVGVDHSGTTIFYKMMARHRGLAWFSQYSLRDGNFPGRARVPLHGWINRAGRASFDFTWRKEAGRLLPEPREGAGIWRRLVPREDGFLDRSDYSDQMADRVRKAISTDLEAWRLRRMLVKIPYLTRAIGLLDAVFPDALFIHLVRDGRAVALSNRKRFMERGLDATEALTVSARRWTDTLAYIEGLEQELAPRLMTLHYEEYCEDVHGSLLAVLDFCGLDRAAIELSPVPSTLRPTNGGWLAKCSPPERELLDRLMAPTLRRWGYSTFSEECGSLDRERVESQMEASRGRSAPAPTSEVQRA
jgi:hypothetical protein